jgi:transcriptional regulator with XRE-family HTH domain
MADRDGDDPDVGGRIRLQRTSRGLSVRALAQNAGITAGALSQIENGRNSPTVTTLKKVLAAMGLTLGEFFGQDGEGKRCGGFAYRASNLVNIAPGKGLRYLSIPGGSKGRALQVLHETYAPGSSTGAQAYHHAGEEAGFCLSGSIEITVGGRREILGPGDAYSYSSRIPHRFRNVGRIPAVIVSACTPPSF